MAFYDTDRIVRKQMIYYKRKAEDLISTLPEVDAKSKVEVLNLSINSLEQEEKKVAKVAINILNKEVSNER